MPRKLMGWLSQYTLFFAKFAPTGIPLKTTQHLSASDRSSDNLIVLLPGIMDKHFRFEEAGFINEARKQKIDADILLVDAHVGYYAQEKLLTRLSQDVFEPARNLGYRNIWLGGISLGGLGSSLFSTFSEEDLKGIILIAPYLGDQNFIRTLQQTDWPKNKLDPSKNSEYLNHVWNWLGEYFENPKRSPALYLGFGINDRFSYSQSLLAEALPSQQVVRIPGGHDWQTWAKIWSQLLEKIKFG